MTLRSSEILKRLAALLSLTILFFFSLEIVELTAAQLEPSIKERLRIANNPAVALFIGLIITAVFQSSSATVSWLIAITSAGLFSITHSIYILIGANIGNTITGTIVATSYIYNNKQYRKALATCTIHDFFNFFTALILFPLEYFYGFLSGISLFISKYISPGSLLSGNSLLSSFIADFSRYENIFFFVGGSVLIVASLKLIVICLKDFLLEEDLLRIFLKKSLAKSFWWGVGSAAVLQSSSALTSTIVPAVAANKIPLKRIFPFVLGTNLGTTFTVLVAAFSLGEGSLVVAIAHLMFNLVGIIILLPIESIRKVPLFFARKVGKIGIQNRFWGYVYLIAIFFLVPFMLILFLS